MASKEKEQSLLEVALELFKEKRTPQKMERIIEEVMTTKGLKPQDAKEATPQFIMDFMLSGNFVFCGYELDKKTGKVYDTWDLKERQPTSMLDRDGLDMEEIYSIDEDIAKYEMTEENPYVDEFSESPQNDITPVHEDDEDEDDSEKKTDDEDDLSNEFEMYVPSVDDEDEEDDENDDEDENN